MYTLSFNIDTQTSVKIESTNRNFIDRFIEQLTTTERNVNNIQINLYKRIREVASEHHAYSDQMMAIAVFVDTEFEQKK